MPTRCLNRVILIGNLTRDPELRYTPGGMAVVSFGMATNRVWVTKQGEKKEDAQFHRIVAWNKLAELCSQLLKKGRRVYVEGRIQYREFNDSTGNKKQITEITIDDMILLDNKNINAVNLESQGNVDFGGTVTAPLEDTIVDAPVEDITIPDDLGVEEPVAEVAKDKPDSASKDEMPF